MRKNPSVQRGGGGATATSRSSLVRIAHARVVARAVLAGEGREHSHVPRHRIAHAEGEAVGTGLAPELEDDAAVAGRHRAGEVEQVAVQVQTKRGGCHRD
jgi:hypothetical protein